MKILFYITIMFIGTGLYASKSDLTKKIKNFQLSFTSIMNNDWIIVAKDKYLHVYDRETKVLKKKILCTLANGYKITPSVVLTATDNVTGNQIYNKILIVDLEEGNVYLVNLKTDEISQVNNKPINGSPELDTFKTSYGNLYYTYIPVPGENFEYTAVIDYSSYL